MEHEQNDNLDDPDVISEEYQRNRDNHQQRFIHRDGPLREPTVQGHRQIQSVRGQR